MGRCLGAVRVLDSAPDCVDPARLSAGTNALSFSYSRMSLHQSSKVLRESLAATVSSLRRVRPRVPFFQLGAHTLPTKWTLYRQLLRRAPTENVGSQQFIAPAN